MQTQHTLAAINHWLGGSNRQPIAGGLEIDLLPYSNEVVLISQHRSLHGAGTVLCDRAKGVKIFKLPANGLVRVMPFELNDLALPSGD